MNPEEKKIEEKKIISCQDQLEKELKELKKAFEDLKQEKAQYLSGWQRSRADFLNYIKDEQERIQEMIKYANESTIVKILPIIDSFDSAQEVIPQDLTDNQYIQGFLRIRGQLKEFLEKEGIIEIKSELGEKFDPRIHEAVGTIKKDLYDQDCIGEIVKKGYKLKDKIIRPAQVKIVSGSNF